MAIVSISRIQHRRGLNEDLSPTTLAGAELGWSLDTRQLYIGNGELAEGAPTQGRTEVLTEYSDILNLFSAYTYQGEAGGYTVQTGPTASGAVARSLQSKLDDVTNLRDFITPADATSGDFSAAINRALNQLFCQQSNTSVRRVLHIPAGIYPISSPINIPTYATVVGDGMDSTIIRQTNSTSPGLVFELSDSKNQTGANIGNNQASRPSYIDVRDITFHNTTYPTVGTIFAADTCRFDNVKFQGNLNFPTDLSGGNVVLLNIGGTPVLNSRRIHFIGCSFNNGTRVTSLDNDMQDIAFNECYFEQLFEGITVGKFTGQGENSTIGPKSVRIVNSYFTNIAGSAIWVYPGVRTVTSGFNYYGEVANRNLGNSTPIAPVIIFEDDNNTSIGDQFERNDAAELLFPRVQHTGTSTIVQYPGEMRFGNLRQLTGRVSALLDNQIIPTLTGIGITGTSQVALLDYSVRRGAAIRVGTMRMSKLGSQFHMEDDFTDNNIDAGIVFSISTGGDGLLYTSTATGAPAEFKYAVRYLT
jgi:hypothetical protein